MSVVVTGSSTELSCNRTSLQYGQLTVQTVSEHHDFFSQTGRRSRLSVSLGQHWDVFPFLRIRCQLVNQLLNLRIIHFFQRILDRQRHRSVVDILRSQSEMDELLVRFQTSQFIELFFDEVLYSLHIVIGHTFDFFDTLSVSFREITVNVAQ